MSALMIKFLPNGSTSISGIETDQESLDSLPDVPMHAQGTGKILGAAMLNLQVHSPGAIFEEPMGALLVGSPVN